ncbi:MAG: hypothetical protein FH748_06495 [Balneolaceae bacterium]|nr:hypothetical protein [Balneolaceae bacterium]
MPPLVRKQLISFILAGSILFLPAALAVGFSFIGEGHPLESKSITQNQFLAQSKNQVEVVFFGYVGCASICPSSLVKVKEVLEKVEKENKESAAGAFFVDIDTESKGPSANEYSHLFSPKIRGINIEAQELEALTKDFGVRVNESFQNPGEIFHTDHFFVVHRKNGNWKIYRVLSNESDQQTIKQVVSEALALQADV